MPGLRLHLHIPRLKRAETVVCGRITSLITYAPYLCVCIAIERRHVI